MSFDPGGHASQVPLIVTGTTGRPADLLGDQLGSTSVAYRADGSETLRQFYHPWGGLRGSSEPVVPTDVGFTGQRLDTSTGLMFYQARYYDPLIGRFISPDSLVPDPSDPQDLNRYSYVSNNPATNTDPSGHCVIAGQQIYAGPCRQTGSDPWDYGYDYGPLDDPDTNGCVNCRDDNYYWRDAVGEDPVIGGVRSAPKAVAHRASEFWHDNKDSIMPVLEAAKNVGVTAVAMVAAGAVCEATAGVGCPFAVAVASGMTAGALVNIAGDELLDCAYGACGEISPGEVAIEATQGAFLGGTGTGLGYQTARTLGMGRAVAGLWAVARDPRYGLIVAGEVAASQAESRLVRLLANKLFVRMHHR
jgi:RHS repeat-associated protein